MRDPQLAKMAHAFAQGAREVCADKGFPGCQVVIAIFPGVGDDGHEDIEVAAVARTAEDASRMMAGLVDAIATYMTPTTPMEERS